MAVGDNGEVAAGENASAGADWTAAMRRGDFAGGWAISDAVLAGQPVGMASAHLPRHFQRIWSGESLLGKCVLVRCYHGLGDTLQFVRFMRPLRELAASTILWAQPELLPIVASTAGVDRALPLHDGAPDVPYDVDIEIMELAHALRITPASLPCALPYLRVPAPQRCRRNENLHVGLIWRAGEWDPRRSISVDQMASLGQVPGVRLISLQLDPEPGALRRLGAARLDARSIKERAAQMMSLDLVISVDTMAAHLAGALGRPVWTLLHAECDWRWMEGRSDTPWYPTMRLFRQPRPADWASVVDEVASELLASVTGMRPIVCAPTPMVDRRSE
jgi:hypothetical protein